ncbi:Pol protein [Phytophthora palmivora]|uniref:Pol protein n=1 Tax=Phytophthora palmivora TaxID=4796 RepID=A0A2P4XUA7_9STRA|nr:Pol protein [Phytophthora palmivora]
MDTRQHLSADGLLFLSANFFRLNEKCSKAMWWIVCKYCYAAHPTIITSTAWGALNMLDRCRISQNNLNWACRMLDSNQASLQHAPVMALSDVPKSFSVVCDASNSVIAYLLFQKDDENRARNLKKTKSPFIDDRLTLISRVRNAITRAQGNNRTLLDKKGIQRKLVNSVGSNKLKHHFTKPFAVLSKHSASFTIDLPKSMTTHPTFYVRHLKRYHDPQGPCPQMEKTNARFTSSNRDLVSLGGPDLPVSEPAKGVQDRNRNSAINTPVEFPSLVSERIYILTMHLKAP